MVEQTSDIMLRKSRTNVSDFDDWKRFLFARKWVSRSQWRIYSYNDSIRRNTNNQLSTKSNKKTIVRKTSAAKPKYGVKKEFLEENDEEKKQIVCLLKSTNESSEERRNNNVHMGSEYHSGV